MTDNNELSPAERREVLENDKRVRELIREEIAVPVLTVQPTKQCDRLIAGLLDSLKQLKFC